MKSKRITAVVLAAAMGIGGLSLASGSLPKAGNAAQGDMSVTAYAAASPSAPGLANAVKNAYGKNNLPSLVKLNKSEIKDRYGVSPSWYGSASAEVAMISISVDELVIFKAKNASSKKKILSAIKQYQSDLKKDTMQYPQNLYKIQGSKVYAKGNYVCFFMLGQVSRNVEENGTDSEIIQAYQKQNQKAVNVIKRKLK